MISRAALAIASCLIVVANPAFATTFECTTKQAFEWKDGALKPEAIFAKTVLRIDDKKEELWMAERGELGPVTQGKIELPLGPEHDLIFTRTTIHVNPEGKEGRPRRFILHIRDWSIDHETLKFSATKLTFIAYEDSPPRHPNGGLCEIRGWGDARWWNSAVIIN